MNNTGYPSADRPWLALYPDGIADGEKILRYFLCMPGVVKEQ